MNPLSRNLLSALLMLLLGVALIHPPLTGTADQGMNNQQMTQHGMAHDGQSASHHGEAGCEQCENHPCCSERDCSKNHCGSSPGIANGPTLVGMAPVGSLDAMHPLSRIRQAFLPLPFRPPRS
jgi:hypothetical protein